MKKFKDLWEIKANWQLIFPILGLLGLIYSSYKLTRLFVKDSLIIEVILTIIISIALLKLTLFIFKKLENKWNLTYRWEMIRVFIVFAITGSSSVVVSKPIFKLIGITKDNLNGFVYWTLYILIGFIFYQFLLIIFGWVFGQHKFFWDFEKKMLRRMKLGFLVGSEK